MPQFIIPHQGMHRNIRLISSIIEVAKEFNIPIGSPKVTLKEGETSLNYASESYAKEKWYQNP